MMLSDQELLLQYVTGNHSAFRELVERHAGLVYAAAWRITGDRMVAEEVVQDVFCLLARKGAVLSGHPVIAGWLHRTAVHTARRQRRARVTREQKLAQFASEEPGPATADSLPAGLEQIDAAINRLPADERTVVVLRFFQELDYAQISSQLGITEAAARKRLSRGLQHLHRLIGGVVTAGLAPACLAMAAPVDLVRVVAAAAPVSPPSAGLFSWISLMNAKLTTGVVVATLLTGGLTWFSASLLSENRRLQREVAHLLAANAVEKTKAAEPSLSAAQSTPKSAVTADQLALLQAELNDEKTKRAAAEQDAKTVRQQVAQLKDEVVVSYGKVTQIGSTLGSVFSEALALAGLEKKGELSTPENEIRFAKFLERASSISGLSREIIGFEDNPEEGSHFIASAYGAVFGLSEAEQEKIAGFFGQKLTEAGEKKFTLSNLPERGSAEFEPWLEKRWAWFGSSREDLRQLIPADKQAAFDQQVEKGGYGFKNMKLKGMPLMFSLGGDPR